jgi:serine/threonine-protein kinase
MTLRLECLDQRARELGALVRMFGGADQGVVNGAAESLGHLSPVNACADVTSLTAPIPPPTPAIALSVAAVRGELAEVRALEATRRFDQAVTSATELVANAEALGYAPLVGEAKLVLGSALEEKGQDQLAVKTLEEAADMADEGKHDLVRGQALVAYAYVLGRRFAHYDASIAAATTALHVAHRLGNDSLEADALRELARSHGNSGRVEEGLHESTAALAIQERTLGPDDVDLAASHVAISIALAELGRFDEAEREDRRALAIVEKAYGPAHPRAAVYRGNVSVDLVWAGRAQEAVPVADEAIRVMRAAVGTEHPEYAVLVNDKSYALTKLGRFADAKPLNEEALAVAERVVGSDSAAAAYPLVGLGEDLIGLGKPAEALPLLERATRLAENNALDPETIGECHFHLARAVWLASKDAERSAALARKAVADYQRSPRLAPRAKAAEDFAKAREAGVL